MEDLKAYYFLIVCFVLLSTLSVSLSIFQPEDNLLLSAGSSDVSSVYNRVFLPDDYRSNPSSPLLSSCSSTIVTASELIPDMRFDVHRSARIFTKPSKYSFEVKNSGIHIVRLHFFPFSSSDSDLSKAIFHVLIDRYVALTNFSVSASLIVKEYFVPVYDDELVIEFVPVGKGNFAFINAIEVLSAPKDLIPDRVTLANDGSVVGFSGHALETSSRLNVGGSTVTPFNDTLWRTWLPDDKMYKSENISEKVHLSGRIQYMKGGASREVAPDFVYNTARVISSEEDSVPDVNMTWEIPIAQGYKHLVRLHFCDIASIAINMISFNVYINGYLAAERVDLSSFWRTLASPIYQDFVVDAANSGLLSVSIGPSNESFPHTINGILNGIEVMKMNNTFGSLDGDFYVDTVLKNWQVRNLSIHFHLLAAICLLLGASFILYKRVLGYKNDFSWTRLPTSVPEMGLKPSTTGKL